MAHVTKCRSESMGPMICMIVHFNFSTGVKKCHTPHPQDHLGLF